MESIVLRTGKTTLVPLLKVLTLSLRGLFESKPISAYEFVQLCRDPSHQLFGRTGAELLELSLVEMRGTEYVVREDVRDIVLASIEGEELGMHLVNPVGVQMETRVPAMAKTASLGDYKLYCAVRRIADLICDAGIKREAWFADNRGESSNPYYNQTASGLFLEHYYGGCGTLWTPWGKWGFLGSTSGDWDKVWEDVFGSLGATLHEALERTEMGEFGPVFGLHRLDGGPLPEPVELAMESFDSYENVCGAWSKLTERYKASK